MASEGARTIVVTVPMCPPRECSPNYRQAWRGRHEATKAFRRAAYSAAMQKYGGFDCEPRFNGEPIPIFSGNVIVRAVIAWGKGRKSQDPANAIGSLKPALDGLEDAAIVANDKQIQGVTISQCRDPEGRGYVMLTVEAAP